MSSYWDQFFGSSTANICFGVVLVFVIYIKRRIKVSKCKTNCHWFECESQLDELHGLNTEVKTQRGMIAEIQQMIIDINRPQTSGFVLTTPRRTERATSV